MTTTAVQDKTLETIALGLTSADEAPERVELPVSGELPAWLSGTLLRNGPARWDFDETEVNHWFDGMSMVHSFEMAGGRVHYLNRFIESRAYKAFRDSGKLQFSEFASDPCRTRFQRIQTMFRPNVTDNPCINAFKFGDEFIALSETPMAYEFDPETLETVGVAYENPDMFATAHPHLSGEGKMLNLSAKFGPRNSQSFFELTPNSHEVRRIAKFPRRLPTYQHSFGMTDRWLIFTEFPFVVDPFDILKSGRPFIENFNYRPAKGTKITIVDRETGEIGGEWQAKPGFCFHHVNAWEEDGAVVFDLCRFEDASIVEALYLDSMRKNEHQEIGAYLHRYRLEPKRDHAIERRLSDEPMELPRINYKDNNCRPYRYAYGVGAGAPVPFDRLLKIDVESGEATQWSEQNSLCGEPVFVGSPDATAEDDGVLLTVVLDGDAGRSFLLVLDASDMTEIARAEVSHHIPAGFHGNFSRS
ncbi:MAG: carotenoid oxygenase family protein [Solirubrobacterales bacterium]